LKEQYCHNKRGMIKMHRGKNISCIMSVREKRRWSFRMVNVTGLEEEKGGSILKCLRSRWCDEHVVPSSCR